MKFHLILVQYDEAGAMPTVHDAWDEFIRDENPEGYERAVAQAEALVRSEGSGVVTSRVITLVAPDAAILRAFAQPPDIRAEVEQ